MKTWKTWTHREEVRLCEMRGRGLSLPAIAAALGRSCASVKDRVAQLAAPKYRPPSLLVVDLCGPHDLRRLADKHGLKYGSVKAAKRRARRRGVRCLPAGRAS